ncbi:MAG TPA: nucleotidyltransferase family protein [Pyrinomonadaceae bacterium]|nr:nucleotidyltransferase family protein [Pyrinomonadaceae bacterium]
MEKELLLCIARRKLREDKRAELRRLARQPLDFDYLFSKAQTHGLLPLLQKHLATAAADLLPGHFLSRLKRETVANSQNMLHLLGRQLTLCKVFEENGVPIAIFKGALLSQMAYGEIALRAAGDIDALIGLQDFTRAKQLLESLGYEMSPKLTPRSLDSHLNHHCELQFMRDEWFTIVDLHWALAPKSFVFKLETDEVMSRLQSVEIAGAKIKTLATEDLILYLSMHGAKHLWRGLEWISSLGEVIRAAESIAWPAVIERAAKAHATRMLALGLHLAERVSDVDIPGEVLTATDDDGSMRKMSGEIMATIFDEPRYAESTETNLYNLKIMDRKRDALVSALRAIFVPTFTDWQSLNLPPSLHSLYYAYRPLRLSKVYSAALWRKLGSRGAACL